MTTVPINVYPPTLQKDVYKEGHRKFYHPEVSEVYSNFTNRSGHYAPNNKLGGVVSFGLQRFIKEFVIETFNKDFFNQKKEVVCPAHSRILSAMVGYKVDVKYLEDLHDLGYLPLEIKGIKEGVIVPYQVPTVTFRSTKEGFQWLTNALETVASCELWPMQTSATTAANFKLNFLRAAKETGIPEDFVIWQGHDFSFRGMFGRVAAAMSGLAHLTSFAGTDTIPALTEAEKYYGANVDIELVGGSVDATEHSVTCSWQKEGELAFLDYLMNEASPRGILSIVADTWDFWNLVTNLLPQRKAEILARDGKVVIRPDSGDPVDILCGTDANVYTGEDFFEVVYEAADSLEDAFFKYKGVLYQVDAFDADDFKTCYNETTVSQTFMSVEQMLANGIITVCDNLGSEAERKGLIECLWDIFGGFEVEVDGKKWKHLDPHIGAIYGDSITIERQEQIIKRLKNKGFAPAAVMGIGSFTYQHVTRDTHGSAVKATSVIKSGVREAIFKAPKTDTSKSSAKGLLMVDENLILHQDVSESEEKLGMLETIFLDGKLLKETTLKEVRETIDSQLKSMI